jgi:hypothetical protein
VRIGAFEVAEPVPELRNTCAIANLRPWVDVGRVGTLALRSLEQHMGAQELGRLARPGEFFDFTRYRPRMRDSEGARTLTIPNSVANHAHDPETDRDYIFLHLREPHAMAEDYTEAVTDLLRHFDVTEYCRIGGMYDSVPHTRSLLVTGTLNENQAERVGSLVSPRRGTYRGPTSIVNMVTEALTQLEVATTSLMVHAPQYAQLDEDYMGAFRLTEVLCAMYGFPSSLADSSRGERQYRDLSGVVENNPEAKALVRQLEAEYDRAQYVGEEEEEVSLSPEVEKFLGDMGERLGRSEDEE